MSGMVHIRNGRVVRRVHGHDYGDNVTWCGKKLLGKPEYADDGTEIFTSYGSEVRVTMGVEGTCETCRTAFDKAYAAAFPEGVKPIATFRLDDPEDMARAKALFSPTALTALLRNESA